MDERRQRPCQLRDAHIARDKYGYRLYRQIGESALLVSPFRLNHRRYSLAVVEWMEIHPMKSEALIRCPSPNVGEIAPHAPPRFWTWQSTYLPQQTTSDSQRRIPNEAGIRLNTLQHYFGTREELLRSAIQELARRYIAERRMLTRNNARSLDDRLERIVDQAFDLLTGPERYTRAPLGFTAGASPSMSLS